VRDDRQRSLDRADWSGADKTPERGDLSRRLASLPDGHPSSSYTADGSRRQPSVSLRNLETGADGAPVDQVRPLSDAEWSDHVTEVRAELTGAHRARRSTDQQYTIDQARKIWSTERDLIHDSIVEYIYETAYAVPCDGRAIIAGGLGGAGKTTVLRESAGIDLTQYFTINPDDIKEEMARRGLIPELAGLTPMEASDLVHEESSHIAKRLAHRAEAEGKNVIWDITMASYESTASRIENLRTSGYKVQGIFVDISVESSIRRADARHREGHEYYRNGVGLGGRYVPPEVIRAQADSEWGSKNRKIFETVKDQFDYWQRYDNSVNGRAAVLAETSPQNDKVSKEHLDEH
jgi:predicted kinase